MIAQFFPPIDQSSLKYPIESEHITGPEGLAADDGSIARAGLPSEPKRGAQAGDLPIDGLV
jgi:hypothetical protein